MQTIKQLTLTIALTLMIGFLSGAQAQTPSIEVATDRDQVRFAVQEQVAEVRVQLSSSNRANKSQNYKRACRS